MPLKIDLAARTDRVQHRSVGISDPEKLISFQRSAGLAPLQEAGRLNLTKAHLQDQVEPAAGFPDGQPGDGEQRFGGLWLEYPPHALLRLHKLDRRVAVIGHQRGQRVTLSENVSRVLGARPAVEIARQRTKALEPCERIGWPKRDGLGHGLGEGQRRDDEPDRRSP